MTGWVNVSDRLPPEGVLVDTKIDDLQYGERNHQPLYLSRKLWWVKDGSMYVYYRPTHWRLRG